MQHRPLNHAAPWQTSVRGVLCVQESLFQFEMLFQENQVRGIYSGLHYVYS